MFRNIIPKLLVSASPTKTKMVLVVRSDLKMSSGKVASQCAHAAVIAYHQASNSSKRTQIQVARQWFLMGQPKIVLKINNEETMKELYQSAIESKLNAVLVHDAGRTQIACGTLTVLCIGPNEQLQVDELTKHLKLL